jgi:hypothetical protein
MSMLDMDRKAFEGLFKQWGQEDRQICTERLM